MQRYFSCHRQALGLNHGSQKLWKFASKIVRILQKRFEYIARFSIIITHLLDSLWWIESINLTPSSYSPPRFVIVLKKLSQEALRNKFWPYIFIKHAYKIHLIQYLQPTMRIVEHSPIGYWSINKFVVIFRRKSSSATLRLRQQTELLNLRQQKSTSVPSAIHACT